MLSVPKHGWCNISIGDWSDRASYLTDVPLDILDSLIFRLKHRKITAVDFDAEGWEYVIVFGFCEVYIIESKDENKLYTFDCDIKKLAQEVYDDINNNLYDWSLWNFLADREEVREEDERQLKEKLKELKELLDKEN